MIETNNVLSATFFAVRRRMFGWEEEGRREENGEETKEGFETTCEAICEIKKRRW